MVIRHNLAFSASILFALIASPALAGNGLGKAVQLDGLKTFTHKNPKGSSVSAHGTCGNAVVNISGIANEDALQEQSTFMDNQDAFTTDNLFTSPVVEIVVTVGKKQKKIAIGLQEQSLVQCISTKAGKKLLIGTSCAGNVPECNSSNYYLIDAENLTKEDTEDGCEAKCINRKLGMHYIEPQ